MTQTSTGMLTTTTASALLDVCQHHIFEQGVRWYSACQPSEQKRQGNCLWSMPTLCGYINAAATFEAFMNEIVLFGCQEGNTQPPAGEVRERMRIRDKLKSWPTKYLGFEACLGDPPLQALCTLFDLRNDLAHYKMDYDVPKYMAQLRREGVALEPPRVGIFMIPSWPHELCTTAGVVWAHNCVCSAVELFKQKMPRGLQKALKNHVNHFYRIEDIEEKIIFEKCSVEWQS